MSPPTDHDQKFAAFLERLAKDKNRAALAALRRGLGKRSGEAAEMYPYVIPWLGKDSKRSEDDAHFLTGALFAWHQGSWQRADERELTNLGASFARLAPPSANNREGVERRFVALLNCHRDDLSEHLRHAVGLLKSKDVPIDWAQLLHDIRGWVWESRTVQREWARAFWGQSPAISADTAAAGTGDEPSRTAAEPSDEE